MAHNKRTQSGEFLQQALLNDKDFLRVMVKRLSQNLMEEEITEFLQADPYERTQERQGLHEGTLLRLLRLCTQKTM